MGTDLNQWRFSVGMFNLKCARKKCRGYKFNSPSTINFSINYLISSVWVPLKILLGIFIVFTYSFIIIAALSICVMMYPLFDFYCTILSEFSSDQSYPLSNYLLQAFIHINTFPYYLSVFGKYSIFLFHCHLPNQVKI